jgi:hypothetical protein
MEEPLNRVSLTGPGDQAFALSPSVEGTSHRRIGYWPSTCHPLIVKGTLSRHIRRPNSLVIMADPLSIAASIIAVLQLTVSVIEYLQTVRDARKDRIDFLVEVSGLYHLLLALQNRVDGANAEDPWFAQVRLLGARDGPLDQLKSRLEHLVSKLGPPGGLQVGRALIWKFSKAEIEGVIAKIERIKMLVSLALTNDHL